MQNGYQGRTLLRKSLILWSALLLILCQTGGSQETEATIQSLSLLPEGAPKVTPEMSKDVLAPVKCDKAGSIYFRVSGQSNEFQEPIVRISADGKAVTTFDARRIAGVPRDFLASDFTADSEGNVYQIIFTPSFELFMIHYTNDGADGSKSAIHEVLNPISLSMALSGDLLLAGTPLQIGSSKNDSQLILAVVDKSGKSKGATHLVSVESPFQPRFGDDDRLYVLTRSDIHVFSKTGESIKQFHLGLDDTALRLINWGLFDGSVVAEFDNSSNVNEPFKGVIALFDAATGDPKKSHKLSQVVRGGLACVSGKTFTFLATAPDGHLSLVTGVQPP